MRHAGDHGVRVVLGLLAVAALCGSANAQYYWTGYGANDYLSTPGNWAGGSAPPNDRTADLVFTSWERLGPVVDVFWDVRSVSFDADAGPFTVSRLPGLQIYICGDVTNNSPFSQVFTTQIETETDLAFNANTADLVFNYSVTTLWPTTLTVTGPHNTTLGDQINIGGTLLKQGVGTLYLYGDRNNSGLADHRTAVERGTVVLGKTGGHIAIPGNVDIGNNTDAPNSAVVRLTQDNQITGAEDKFVTVYGSGLLDLLGHTTEVRNLTLSGGRVTGLAGSVLDIKGDLVGAWNSPTAASVLECATLRFGGTLNCTVYDIAPAVDMTITSAITSTAGGAFNKFGPGTLRFGGASANTYTGVTTVNEGTLLLSKSSGAALAGDLHVGTSSGAPGSVTVRQEAAGQFSPTVSAVVDVTGALDLHGYDTTLENVTNSGAITVGAATLTTTGLYSQEGGLLTGTLRSQGTFNCPGNMFAGRLINEGWMNLGPTLTVAGGLQNFSWITRSAGQALTVNGTGLDNQGTLNLTGGTINGTGPIVNNGSLQGTGTIGGNSGLTNNGQISVSAGNLVLAHTGAVANAGSIDIAGGGQLLLTQHALANSGRINLAGGAVGGAYPLNNNAQGTVAGYGNIASPLANNVGGLLLPQGGPISITPDFDNSGEILLGGGAAAITGAGSLYNTGLIRGDGRVSKALTNVLSGELRAEAGKRIQFQGALDTNAALISLQGGTAEFSQAFTNGDVGVILGRGTLIVGGAGLTNLGNIGLSGGFTDIYGDFTNAKDNKDVPRGRITISGGGTATFYDDVVNDGELFRVSQGCAAVFFGGLSGSGSFAGTGTVYIEGDLRPGHSPGEVAFEGDLSLGDGATLVAELAGAAPGSQYDVIDVGGALALGGTLDVELLYGFQPQAGQTFDILNFDPAGLSGEFDAIALPDLGSGFSWDTSNLYTTGAIGVVPEPATLALAAIGLAALVARRRR